LVALGVPLAAWAAIFVVDMYLFRRNGYQERDLYDATGSHGSINYAGTISLIVAIVIGLGFVTSASFSWLGYLLDPFGGRTGAIGSSSIGIAISFVIGGALYAVLSMMSSRRAVQGSPA